MSSMSIAPIKGESFITRGVPKIYESGYVFLCILVNAAIEFVVEGVDEKQRIAIPNLVCALSAADGAPRIDAKQIPVLRKLPSDVPGFPLGVFGHVTSWVGEAGSKTPVFDGDEGLYDDPWFAASENTRSNVTTLAFLVPAVHEAMLVGGALYGAQRKSSATGSISLGASAEGSALSLDDAKTSLSDTLQAAIARAAA